MEITVNRRSFYDNKDVYLVEGNTRIELGYLDAPDRRALAKQLLQAVYDLTWNDIETEEHYSFVLEFGSGASGMVAAHKDDFEYYKKRDAQLEFALDMIPNLDDVIDQKEWE